MQSYTKKVQWSSNPSFKDVKELYLAWEEIAIQLGCGKTYSDFNFSCGTMRCTATSIEEFTEKAYGEKDFYLIAFQFLCMLGNNETAHINYLCDLSISAPTKVLLEKIEMQLNLGAIENIRTEIEKTPVNSYQSIHNNTQTTPCEVTKDSIIVNGNGNFITVSKESDAEKSTDGIHAAPKTKEQLFFQKHPFWSAVLVTFFAGIILLFDFWEDIINFIEQLFS